MRIYPLTGKFLWPGPEIVHHDLTQCFGPETCGKCIERCLFDAISGMDGRIVVDYKKCMGCGLCVTRCVNKARAMTVRKDYAHDHQVPASLLLGDREQQRGDLKPIS